MSSYCHRRYVSKLFQYFGKLQPKSKGNRRDSELGLSCKSHMLMLYNDIIAPGHSGGFHLLPLGQRALEKLIKVVDHEMVSIGGQKVSMTTLAPEALWQKSGRWTAMGSELFTLKDRHQHGYCLGPTHEELITSLIASLPHLSYRQLPIRLYQITRKFRDEMAPKYGLLRGREFEMKDMYSFDTCDETALETYDAVCGAYDRIFDRISVDYVKVSGDSGLIGGDKSHEYHYLADVGQDCLRVCERFSLCQFASRGPGDNEKIRCGVKMNKELSEENGEWPTTCQLTQALCEMEEKKGIEVGHTFFLGRTYSSVFKASYRDSAGNKQIDCSMGCYGLGLTRILQSSIECLSTETNIRWPSCLAPYQICIIPKKDGKAGDEYLKAAEDLSDKLTDLPNLRGEVVIDDRMSLTIGKRQFYGDRLGYPYIVILGSEALGPNPTYEIINTAKGETAFVSPDQLMDFAAQIPSIPLT